MKIFTLIGLFIGLAESVRPNENCWRECDWTEYIALIKCPDAPAEPCTCETKDESILCEAILGADKLRFSGWEECQAKANGHLSDDLASEFFRWEDKATEEYCYFLPNCNIEVPSGCVPFPTANCVAGPSTGPCEDLPDAGNACDPAIWFDQGLHWKCRNGKETVSPYKGEGDTEKIAEGTTCQTDGDCSTWTWAGGDNDENANLKKQATVKCQGGDWISDPTELALKNGTDFSILPNEDDGFCLCDSFVVTGEMRDNPSLSFLCDDILYPNAENSTLIEYPNTCLALCDGHMVKYIECYKGQWANTAEYPFQVVEDIPC